MTLDARARADLLATFKTELADHCQALNRAFLGLEKEPPPPEHTVLLDEAFRAAHSLKGAARVVALAPIEALAHSLESVLARIRQGRLDLSPELFDLLYAVVDTLGGALDERGELAVPATDVERLLRQLQAVQAEQQPAPTTDAGAAAESARRGDSADTPGRDSAEAIARPDADPALPASRRRPEAGETPQASDAAAQAAAASSRQQDQRHPPTGSETIRLSTGRLDHLIEELGELVVPQLAIAEGLAELAELRRSVELWQREWRKVRPRLRQLEREKTLHNADLRVLMRFLEHNEAGLTALSSRLATLQTRLANPSAQLGALSQTLQEEVKSLRMLPFGNLAEGLERALRDLARHLGKEARLVLAGGDTELDRRVLEAIKDPLLHLLRNAVDHGIEPPAERRRLGKPAVGSVAVTAGHRGGEIVVAVVDDGAGVDVGAIRRAAGERGLVPAASITAMADDDVIRLVFLPGLSTRGDVSEVSGRGFGLDVVARNVEHLGGRVDVRTTPGQGTSFAITLPLTLATTRAILVEAGDGCYALPTVAVERILRPKRLGSVGGRLVLEQDGSALPVVVLSQILSGKTNGQAPDHGEVKTLALVATGAQRVALAIDRVVAEREIVVKPLGYPLLRLRHFASATILGSGRVVPILNVGDLGRAAVREAVAAAPPPPAESTQPRRRVLIVEDSLTTRTLERHILEAAGYVVDVAGDGAEALAILQERGCDVLVSDVNMPVLDGIALTAKVRGDPKLRDLPVILVTALDAPADRERGLEVGADAYIVKSAFDQDHLLRTIRELTE